MTGTHRQNGTPQSFAGLLEQGCRSLSAEGAAFYMISSFPLLRKTRALPIFYISPSLGIDGCNPQEKRLYLRSKGKEL